MLSAGIKQPKSADKINRPLPTAGSGLLPFLNQRWASAANCGKVQELPPQAGTDTGRSL